MLCDHPRKSVELHPLGNGGVLEWCRECGAKRQVIWLHSINDNAQGRVVYDSWKKPECVMHPGRRLAEALEEVERLRATVDDIRAAVVSRKISRRKLIQLLGEAKEEAG
jgi:hypothetical protein